MFKTNDISQPQTQIYAVFFFLNRANLNNDIEIYATI